MAIFQGKAPDRPAVKLWGAFPEKEVRHPAYEPILKLAIERTDLMVPASSPFNLYCGAHEQEIIQKEEIRTVSDEWVDVVTTWHTPDGTLQSTFRKSTCGKPGYRMEHPLKEPDDIKKLVGLPYEPFEFDSKDYVRKRESTGDTGIVLFSLDHAAYGLQRLIGSERFGIWSLECRDTLLEAVKLFACRIREHASRVMQAGIRPVFGWVGPELFIPPLMSPDDFNEFVYDVDKALVDLIHNGGGYVWTHCHGRMRPVLEGFVEMGVDVLNPIEPPPMGDITLEEAFAVAGDRMGLEGNIETHDLMMLSSDALEAKIRHALSAGSNGRRFILCPSSGFDEDANPSERHLGNLFFYVKEGVRIAEQYGGH